MHVFRITCDGVESHLECQGQRVSCTHFVSASVLADAHPPGMLPGYLVNRHFKHGVDRFYDTPQITEMRLRLDQHNRRLQTYLAGVRLALRGWNADMLHMVCDKLACLLVTTCRVSER